jgi:hypothetical protein
MNLVAKEYVAAPLVFLRRRYSARGGLCGLRLASALKSAVCDDGRGKA